VQAPRQHYMLCRKVYQKAGSKQLQTEECATVHVGNLFSSTSAQVMSVHVSIFFSQNTRPAIVCYHYVTSGHLCPPGGRNFFWDKNIKTPWFGFDLVTRSSSGPKPLRRRAPVLHLRHGEILHVLLNFSLKLLTGYH